jgi:hypothetical protein
MGFIPSQQSGLLYPGIRKAPWFNRWSGKNSGSSALIPKGYITSLSSTSNFFGFVIFTIHFSSSESIKPSLPQEVRKHSKRKNGKRKREWHVKYVHHLFGDFISN